MSSWGQYGIKWVAHCLHPQFSTGSVASSSLGCEGKGQREANQQTALLHPDVAEDDRGSSLDVLKTQHDWLQTQPILFWDKGFFYSETFILLLFLSSTMGQKCKHHFSTSLMRYDAASTIRACNEEVLQRKKEGVFMSSPTYFNGSKCAVPPHLPVSVLSRVMSFGIGNRCVCEMCRSLLYPQPPHTSPSPCQRSMTKAMEEGEQRKHRGT